MSTLNLIRAFRLQSARNVAKLSRIWTRVYSDDSSKSLSDDLEKKDVKSWSRKNLDPSKRLESMFGEQNIQIDNINVKFERNGNSESIKDRPEVWISSENNSVTSTDNEKFSLDDNKPAPENSVQKNSEINPHSYIDNVMFSSNDGKLGLGNSLQENSEIMLQSSTDNKVQFSSNTEKPNKETSETSSHPPSDRVQFSSSEHKPNQKDPFQEGSQPSTEDRAKFFSSRTTRRRKLSPLQRYSWMIENADDSLKERLDSDEDQSLKDLKKLADDLKNKQ